MLPPKPQIFYGRKSELEDIIKILAQDSPRLAILGGGGMGKTSLAKAALHHPDISTKFEHRYFISAESAATSTELAALVGLHLGVEPGNDFIKCIIQYFSRRPPCLLILDNLETPWEPLQSRGAVEEFISLLTDVPHLALIVGLNQFFQYVCCSCHKDHNARCRTTSKGCLDSSIFATSQAFVK